MVFYFSGTGNSKYVAESIGKTAKDTVVSIGDFLKQGKTGRFTSEKPLVFVAPTYAWRMPRLVEDFIKASQFSGNQTAYFVLTCGGSTYRAADFAEKLCKEKGFIYSGFAQIVMPENYIALFQTPDKAQADDIIEKAKPDIEKTAQHIAAGTPLPEQKRKGRLFSHVINPIFYKLIVKDKGFYATEACISCGDCATLCPLNNITLPEGMPVWGGNCTHCMACIGGCPTQAIEYKKNSQNKPRYFRPNIMDGEKDT